ncbi:MAG: AMP-binding protein, partial [Acidimicrobiaceae bacterium]|nr:AMP-binding protein [Acidimicrobiaceae bacterium]
GVPKFCEQTHEYFLRLGRFIADSMCLSAADTVLAPLPMFHINPLGYGVVGGLTGGTEVLGLERFSARGFWPLVRDTKTTALILHAPPVEILKRATSAADAAGHRVSRVFFADPDFLETFGVPLGFSAYGSTEAGGLCHIWTWRRGERPDLAEGMSRYGGRARHEVQWRVGRDGEIAVRADRPGVLFSGYRRNDGLDQPFDADGWFATGDLGRVDDAGNLVFIERASESIRVKGEFVPIGYVEQRFASVDSLDDVAVWRRSSDLVDDEIVLYVTGRTIPRAGIRAVSEDLPPFMRPAAAARVAEIPRDSGVGKVRRRLLHEATVLEWVDLAEAPG